MQDSDLSLRRARFQDFEVDFRAGELRRQGHRIRLQEKPFQVLAALLEHPGEVVTREQLREKLWAANTFVEFDDNLNTAVKKLREALGDSATHPHFVETLPRHGYRFIAPVQELEKTPPAGVTLDVEPPPLTKNKRWKMLVPVILGGVVVLGSTFSYFRPTPLLTESDYLLLADFDNRTSEPVFDGTLRDALAVKLDESPYLNIVSDDRVRETLQLMGRPPDEPLAGPTAREVCLRLGIRALVDGSIAALGSHYLLTLNAADCQTGESLAREQAEVRAKEEVIQALGQAGSRLRHRLGESLSSLERFDAPLEQVTTSSLEALRFYTIGQEIRVRDRRAAIPYFQHAIELDPSFARAHAVLGTIYGGELGDEHRKKAFQLRDRVSNRERLYIMGHYYHHVTGEIQKARGVYELWTRTYPRDWTPYNNLRNIYSQTAQIDRALAAAQEAIRLEPSLPLSHFGLGRSYMRLNRLREAKAEFEKILQLKVDYPRVHPRLYLVAFIEGDTEAMELHARAMRGKTGQSAMLRLQGETRAYRGKLREANEFFEKVIARGRRGPFEGFLATTLARAALWDAEFGYNDRARKRAREAVSISSRVGAPVWVGIALARAGDLAQAEAIADELSRRRPLDTLLNCREVVAIRAIIELQRGNPAEAIELLKGALQDELGGGAGLVAIYVRGQAYLQMGAASDATAEFQKIVDNRTFQSQFPYHALAHHGLGRAYALAGEIAKSRQAYEAFFSLWKDADPDIPILQEARGEYAKLQ